MSTAQIFRAATFAAEKHRSKRRKDRDESPYINHPLAVAEILARHGFTDPVLMQAALLHDTVEDTDTTEAELEKEFGGEVARLVMEVTDDKQLPKAERKRLQVEHAPSLSDAARLVKLGDKICNVRDMAYNPPADWSDERRRDYFEWTKQVVAGCRGLSVEMERQYDYIVDTALEWLP